MKVLHVITSLQMGGAEKLMVDLLPRFNRAGIECDLLTFNGALTPFRNLLEKAGVKIYDFGVKNRVYSPLNVFRLVPFLRKYDIVHTHNTAPQLFAALGSVVCSVVLCTTEHTTSNRRRDWKWYAPIDKWMYSRYSKVISISDKTQECLKEKYPDLKTELEIIYNGISLEDYSNVSTIQQLEDNGKGTIKIMMVAGFRYQKDQPTAIRALKFLPEKYHLYLVGDGVKRCECEALAQSLSLTDRVHFLGRRNDVPSLLKSTDICLISSHWEGFGLAAVEGMAAGKPVIASDIPGVAEVVRGAGILFRQGDAQSLASKIIELTTDEELYQNTVTACIERAKEFSIEKMVKGYIEVYNDLYNKVTK